MEGNDNKKLAIRISIVTIVLNFLLMVFKLVAGLISNSFALISDAIHTASDVLSTFVVIFGIIISAKKNDRNHAYGHERFECVAAIILSVMLFATGIGIGWVGINDIVSKTSTQLKVGSVALIASIVSIIAKEIMYWLTIIVAKKINSGALKADAWHHRSDALSSVGSLIGVIGAIFGVFVLDSIACVIICLFILKVSISIFVDAIRKMTDESADVETEQKLMQIISDQNGVVRVDLLRTRKFGDKIYVEVNICADGNLNLRESHSIAHNVEKETKKSFSTIKECFVHVNPCELKSED